MDCIGQYLRWQDFGGKGFEARYQLLKWVPSTIIAGVQVVDIPTDKEGNVLFIRVVAISISTDGLGGLITFKDNRLPTILFSIINNISFFDISPFDYLANDTKLRIVSNSATVQFSLAYAPITTDTKDLKAVHGYHTGEPIINIGNR